MKYLITPAQWLAEYPATSLISMLLVLLAFCILSAEEKPTATPVAAIASFTTSSLTENQTNQARRFLMKQLKSRGDLQVMDSATYSNKLIEKGLTKYAACPNVKCAAALGKRLGVDIILVTKIDETDFDYVIRVFVVDVYHGTLRQKLIQTVNGSWEDFLGQVQTVAEKVKAPVLEIERASSTSEVKKNGNNSWLGLLGGTAAVTVAVVAISMASQNRKQESPNASKMDVVMQW
jgi:hypothetical protein